MRLLDKIGILAIWLCISGQVWFLGKGYTNFGDTFDRVILVTVFGLSCLAYYYCSSTKEIFKEQSKMYEDLYNLYIEKYIDLYRQNNSLYLENHRLETLIKEFDLHKQKEEAVNKDENENN